MGNEISLEVWYYRYVLIFWPKLSHIDILHSIGPSVLFNQLEVKLLYFLFLKKHFFLFLFSIY